MPKSAVPIIKTELITIWHCKKELQKLNLFRAYDVRGIYPTAINELIALRIGQAFGTFNSGKIAVGLDTRLSSPFLKKSLIKGLLSTGADVIDVGVTTTPVVMFATKFLDCDGGIMVTASHNTKKYNGFKFYRKNGIPISYESGINKIQKIFEQRNFTKGKGKIKKRDIHGAYISFLLKKIKFNQDPSLKIVLDAGNGAAGSIYPDALRKAGMTVIELFCNPDGNFPNHEPDPSKSENLGQIIEKVIETGADLGFAYDGDGDRLAVIDEKGRVVSTGIIFSIIIKNALSKNPGSKVVYTALDSQAIDDVIRMQGGVPIICRVGHTYITQKLLEENARVAGEISGHYYFKETYGADDALFASLRIIESLANSGKNLAEYSKEYPTYFSQTSEKSRFLIKASEKFTFIEQLKRKFKMQGYKIDTLDGAKVIFDDGWAMFRPSNTEPIISISYEAKTEDVFNRIDDFVQRIIATIPK